MCLGRVCGVGLGFGLAARLSWLGFWDMCVFVCALRPTLPLLAGACGVCVCVCWLGFPLCPATPGWGFGVCACLCARSACTPPLLAGVCGVDACALARVSAAPCHSWLGSWVSVLGYPVCNWAWVLACCPPFLPWFWGVCVCLCARSALPRHSWLGCAVWVCWCGLGFQLRPTTPGWGVGVCVSLCARSACTPQLLAGVCDVCVCASARVSAAPRHSWLACWGVCVFVCALRLYPATPGSGVRCGCVCLGSGFGCAPPLLAGTLAVCVFVCALRLYPATAGSGVRCGCGCLGSGCGCAPPLLAWVLGCVCVCVHAPPVPCHSWLGCAVWVCALGLGFWLRPATPGLGVGVCVCLSARSTCTPPLLAGLCAVGVCALALVLAAPRHSWLGCWGVWVCWCAFTACTPPLVAGVCGVGVSVLARVSASPCHSWLGRWLCVFLCARSAWSPATPGWGVRCVCLCFGSGFGCAPPLLAGVLGGVGVCVRPPLVPRHSWLGCAVLVCVGSGFGCAPPLRAGMLGCVCVCVCAPLVPRHSWLGCAVWVCVFGLGFLLRPATPGLGVGVCVCLCARSVCTPPLLAGVCDVGVCALARVLAAPRRSWLGCWDVFVCFCARSACTPPLLAWVCGVGVCVSARVSAAPRHTLLGRWDVCVFVCAFRLYPATAGWGVRCGCVCLGSGFGCAPPLLAGVLGCVCVCVRALLVPCHSWLGCALWVRVVGLGFRLHPATPNWDACVRLCARSACALPLPAGACSAVWVGCRLAAVPVPWFIAGCARCPGLRHPVAVVAWHLSLCLGCGRRRASLACLVAPRWCAAPRPVRWLPVLRSAFPTPWCLSPARRLTPPDLLGGCAGHMEDMHIHSPPQAKQDIGTEGATHTTTKGTRATTPV